MPAISIDTFFACSLIVLLVLSAMATTTKIVTPSINGAFDAEAAKRYREIAEYLLLNCGEPSNWGENGQTVPETFGLAEAGAENPYALDIDKVSRLNGENLYALSYAQIFTSLKIPDASFRLEIKPIFETYVNLTEVFEELSETTYKFEVSTVKNGIKVPVRLRYYVIAQNFLEASEVYDSYGATVLNVTMPNTVKGTALLVIFAKSSSNTRITSFKVYAFVHNSLEPEPNGTFLTLSPLNYNLTALFKSSETTLSAAYALTFNFSAVLAQNSNTNQSATFSIPKLLDSSPMVLVVTGWNSTQFFTEWTSYPQIPLQTGANLSDASNLSNVFAYSYLVTIGSATYQCTVFVGGPRK